MASPSIQVVGVYAVVEAHEPCHLVELAIADSPGFDASRFQQEEPGQPPENWQTAYDERVLSAAGDAVVADAWTLRSRPELLEGKVRLAFFMHYLDPSRPLLTPFGQVTLGEPSDRPARLTIIEYEEP